MGSSSVVRVSEKCSEGLGFKSQLNSRNSLSLFSAMYKYILSSYLPQFLPFPELMPFRLTPQVTNLLLPHSESGQLRSCMVHTLRALHNSPELLLNTMDVLVKEPCLDWKVD